MKYVAEMTINHLGMKNILKKMISSAHDAGSTIVKLKLKNVDNYYSEDGKKWRNFDFKQYRNSLELSREDIIEIDAFCRDRNIPWFCTVHDLDSLNFIKQFDVPYFKIASMDIGNEEFCRNVATVASNKSASMVVSVGGKDLDFTDKLIETLRQYKMPVTLLHTVSIYPTPLGQSNTNRIKILKKRYESEDWLTIGYSGHEIGYAASINAAVVGAEMIERHFTLSRNWNIHHIQSALEPKEFGKMVKLITEIAQEKALSSADPIPGEESFLLERNYN
jgi:sialic acid synthase SpsE